MAYGKDMAVTSRRDAYLALGVQQVWLVDIDDRSVEVCRGRGPGVVIRYTIRWCLPVVDLIVPIDLGEVYAGLP